MSVSLSPTTTTVRPAMSQQFKATLTGTNNNLVTWSVSPAVGTISSTGLYTAPISVTSQTTILVQAVSVADSTKNASARVTLLAGSMVSISMSPSMTTLAASQTQQFVATVSGTSNTAVSWAVNPSVGSISQSGLYTAPTSVTSPQTISVSASSAADPAKIASASITLNPPPAFAITTTNLPSGVVGTPYNANLMATGGTPPYNWTYSSGQLPPAIGLWMLTGALSGTPTASGTYTMVVVVNDSAGHTATAPLAISIVPCGSCPPLTITTTSVPGGSLDTAYSATLAAAGGTPPYSWSVSSGLLPTGLTLATTGALSGIPTTAGSYIFAAQVVDSSVPSATVSATFSLNVPHIVTLSWAPSTTPNVGYYVYRSTTSGGPYARLTPIAQGALDFTDASVSSGQTYFYVTTAVNSSGESGYSEEAQAVVPSP